MKLSFILLFGQQLFDCIGGSNYPISFQEFTPLIAFNGYNVLSVSPARLSPHISTIFVQFHSGIRLILNTERLIIFQAVEPYISGDTALTLCCKLVFGIQFQMLIPAEILRKQIAKYKPDSLFCIVRQLFPNVCGTGLCILGVKRISRHLTQSLQHNDDLGEVFCKE